jgi:hypothetical protein
MNVGLAARCEPSSANRTISHQGKVISMLGRAEPALEATTFYTPRIGKIVCPAIRDVTGTSGIIILQKDRLILEIYTDDQELLCAREMDPWEVAVLLSGEHGFRFLQDTVLLEVKQELYLGAQGKEAAA